jgi:hypothetical protein
MSTLKYKATERYSMGWSDPRREFDVDKGGMFDHRDTGLKDVPTQVLRDLWMVRFGVRGILTTDMPTSGDDIVNVGRELANRKQIRHEKIHRQDTDEVQYYYILEKADGDN